MNGPDHFLKAEEYLRDAKRSGDYPDTEKAYLKYATAHGILAVAAAVATNDRLDGMSVEQLAEWLTAIGASAG